MLPIKPIKPPHPVVPEVTPENRGKWEEMLENLYSSETEERTTEIVALNQHVEKVISKAHEEIEQVAEEVGVAPSDLYRVLAETANTKAIWSVGPYLPRDTAIVIGEGKSFVVIQNLAEEPDAT